MDARRAAPADVDRVQFGIILMTLEHTSIVDRIFEARLRRIEHGFKAVAGNEIPNLGAISATLAETDAWYIDYAKNVKPHELANVLEFQFVSDNDRGRMTKAELLAHIIAHGASHRGGIGKMMENLRLPGASDMVASWAGSAPAR